MKTIFEFLDYENKGQKGLKYIFHHSFYLPEFYYVKLYFDRFQCSRCRQNHKCISPY